MNRAYVKASHDQAKVGLNRIEDDRDLVWPRSFQLKEKAEPSPRLVNPWGKGSKES